jgi:hypothetical protein
MQGMKKFGLNFFFFQNQPGHNLSSKNTKKNRILASKLYLSEQGVG